MLSPPNRYMSAPVSVMSGLVEGSGVAMVISVQATKLSGQWLLRSNRVVE
jgi:hypothetical protein